MKEWDININNNTVYIIENDNGSYSNFDKVEEIAKKTARQNKTIIKIKSADNEKDITIADYRDALLPNELINKQESEVKIYKAELLVAKNELLKNKIKYKKSLSTNQLENYKKYINSINRVRDTQINLRDAKSKLKETIKHHDTK